MGTSLNVSNINDSMFRATHDVTAYKPNIENYMYRAR